MGCPDEGEKIPCWKNSVLEMFLIMKYYILRPQFDGLRKKWLK